MNYNKKSLYKQNIKKSLENSKTTKLSVNSENSYDLELNNVIVSNVGRKSFSRSKNSIIRKSVLRKNNQRNFLVGALIQIYKNKTYLPGIVKRINSDKTY